MKIRLPLALIVVAAALLSVTSSFAQVPAIQSAFVNIQTNQLILKGIGFANVIPSVTIGGFTLVGTNVSITPTVVTVKLAPFFASGFFTNGATYVVTYKNVYNQTTSISVPISNVL